MRTAGVYRQAPSSITCPDKMLKIKCFSILGMRDVVLLNTLPSSKISPYCPTAGYFLQRREVVVLVFFSIEENKFFLCWNVQCIYSRTVNDQIHLIYFLALDHLLQLFEHTCRQWIQNSLLRVCFTKYLHVVSKRNVRNCVNLFCQSVNTTAQNSKSPHQCHTVVVGAIY